ncbi:MAG: hypothetical protein U0269_07685 [Polyangiales bacterium]
MKNHALFGALSLLALVGCGHARVGPRQAPRDCRTLVESSRVSARPAEWTRSTHGDSITTPAVRLACDAIAVETHAQLREVRERPTVLDFSGLGRCASAGRGAWILSVRMGPPRESVSEGTSDLVGEWSAVYIDERGERFDSATARGPIERGLQGASAAKILAVHDIDGDRVGELVVEQTNWDEEGSSAPRQSMYTARGQTVSALSTGSTAERFALVDADADGRIDLQIQSEFYLTTFVGMSSEGASGPSLLVHGLAAAAFASSDDTTLAFRLAQCPRPPSRIVEPSSEDRTQIDATKLITNIACARSWGASAADVLARARAEWLSTDRNETMRDNLEEAVATEPRVSLRGLCPIAP